MIKIFISSTFCDMQAERDIIRNRVLPLVRAHFRRQGISISFTDLRWGISGESMNEKEVMNKILSVCAGEIDSARPFFLILLGDRYGTVPSEESLLSFLSKHPELTYEELRGKSITELELLYALKGEMPSLLVAIRESDYLSDVPTSLLPAYKDDGEKQERLAFLKKSLKSKYPDSIISYAPTWDKEKNELSSLDSLAEELSCALIKQIGAIVGETTLSPEEEALRCDQAILNEHLSRFVERDGYKNEIDSFLKGENELLLISAESGFGKSGIISSIAKSHPCAITMFLGNGCFEATLDGIFKNLIYRLQLLSGTEVFSPPYKSLREAGQICQQYIRYITRKDKLLISLDNITALDKSELSELFNLLPLPNGNENYKLIMSTSEELSTSALIGNKYQILNMSGIDEGEIPDLISRFLLKNGKDLGEGARKALACASLFHSPLYISLAINRLFLLSGNDFAKIHKLSVNEGISENEAHSKYLIDIISSLPQNERELSLEIFDLCTPMLGAEGSRALISLVLLSNEGLRLEDLHAIISKNIDSAISSLDILTFVNSLGEILVIDGLEGRVRFSHRVIKNAFSEKYKDYAKLNTMLFNYLESVDEGDAVKKRLYLTTALSEGEYERACDFLTSERDSSVFVELHYSLLDKNKRGKILRGFDEIVNIGSRLDNKRLNTLVLNIITSVYMALNRAGAEGDEELLLLIPVYEALSNRVSDCSDIELKRSYYMTLEKCGISSSTIERKQFFYGGFLKAVRELISVVPEDYEHIDLIYSDLGFAYEKNGELLEYFKRWSESYALYDEGASSLKLSLKRSEGKADLLEYQKYSLTIKKHASLCLDFDDLSGFGWGLDEETEERLKLFLPELLECERFFLDATQKFVQSQRSMVISSYYHCLLDIYEIISRYYHIKDEPRSEAEYLKKAINVAVKSWRLSAHPFDQDRIRRLYFWLGECSFLSLEERIKYIALSTEELVKIHTSFPQYSTEEHFSSLADSLHGSIIQLYTSLIHPNIDYLGGYYSDENYAENSTSIDEDNLDYVLSLCADYINSTRYSLLPTIYNPRGNTERLPQFLLNTMISTICSSAGLGVRLLASELSSANSYLNSDPCVAKSKIRAVFPRAKLIISILDGYIKKYHRLQGKEWAFYQMARALELLRIASHNLFALGMKEGDKSLRDEFEVENGFAISWLEYLAKLYSFVGSDYKIQEHISALHSEEKILNRTFLPIGDLKLFALCIEDKENLLPSYLKSAYRNEWKHWYLSYRELQLLNNEEINRWLYTVGEYLCNTLSDISTQRIIYHSIFYESAALEYAYRAGRIKDAHFIIENGYDYYLELDTLFIIRQYERQRFSYEIKRLKKHCLKNILKSLSYAPSYLSRLFGKSFTEELYTVVSQEKGKIPKNSPRNRIKRIVPKHLEL